jgi:hypothetical protein
MSDALYRIYPDWKDILVYDEGDGRTLRLDCACIDPIYQVSLPTRDRWNEETPLWAHERRGIILDRLRAANCIICEVGRFVTCTGSPDGTFRVEVYYEPDERGYPLRSIRVVLNDDNFVLVDLPDAGLAGLLQFPQPGMLTLPFSIQSRKYQIGINVREHTFWTHPNEIPRPLDQLAPTLAVQVPQSPAPRIAPLPLRSLLGSIAYLATCVMFVAAGAWQMIDGHKTRDHWIGALCVLFFGLCAAVPIMELRRWGRYRRNPNSQPESTAQEEGR